jgi:hypothetical protein
VVVLRGEEEGNVGVVTAHVGWRGEGGIVQRSESSLRDAALEFTAPISPGMPPVVRKLGEQGEVNWSGCGVV